MARTYKDLLTISFFVLISTFLIWLPHILTIPNLWDLDFSKGFSTIYRNFDGLEYVIIAKSWYKPELLALVPQNKEPLYYASHFPGYPFLITLFVPLLGGYLKSMLFVTVLFTVLATIVFYFLVKDFKLTEKPLPLTLIFTILPARWVIVRSVGSPEPVFIFFVLLSVYFFLKTINLKPLFLNQYTWLSAIFAGFAIATRPPGVLLGLAYGLFILWQGYKQKSLKYILSFYPFLLLPLTLIVIFWWFGQTYQDPLAYFHSGDNIHLFFPPFSIFNVNQYWVGTIWLEDVIYLYILGLLAGLILIKQKLFLLAFVVLTYLFASFFVAHRDISRYTLPIAPFVLIAFEKVLTSKEFKWVLIILGLTIYLYSQNFILNNTAPIPNLSVYN